jgi:hypothetical protein
MDNAIFTVLVLQGCLCRGKGVAPGVRLDLPPEDAMNMVLCGRGVLESPNDQERLKQWQHSESRRLNGNHRAW